MGATSGSSPDRLDTAAMLALARGIEPATSERTLEFWRNQGLLPHAERTGQDGARPVWTYPAQAVDQLHALLRLRTLSKDPHLLRVALWFEGYPVPTARVRSSMISYLRRLHEDINQELARRAATQNDADTARWNAIEEIAGEYARRRTSGARFGRQRLSEREQAFTVLFGLGLGEPAAVDALDTTADAMERAIGLDQARRYHPQKLAPWLTGPTTEGIELFSHVGSLPRLIQTLDTANDADLDAARPVASTLLTGLRTFSHMTDAVAGYRNAAGVAALASFTDNNLSVRILLPAMIVALTRSPTTADNLTALHTALSETILPLHQHLQYLAALSPDELAAYLKNLDNLTWIEQNQIHRLIDTGRPKQHDTRKDSDTQ